MDAEEFRKSGQEMVDYIVDYLESLPLRSVTPAVGAGHLKSVFPPTAPENGESFEKIMEDVEKYIMPGLTHWQHPGFHAFFPSYCSFPSILAAMLEESLGYARFEWTLQPSGNEIETIVLDWYGQLIGLPNAFLRYAKESKGAGVIKASTYECILVCMITARRYILKQLCKKNPSMSSSVLLSSLVAYCTKELYPRIVKSAAHSQVNIRELETDENFRLRGNILETAIKEDKKAGLIPFFVCITLGSICGACDPIDEIGLVCEKHGIWLNINAGYVGTAMMCDEYKHLLNGIEYAQSINANPAKWMLAHEECSVLFVKDRFKLNESITIDRTNLGYSFAEKDWSYPSQTEFRALKLWFVMRMYGVQGLQKHIRNHIQLAKLFEEYVKRDERFEVITCQFGIVCFRLIGSNELNIFFLNALNSSGKIFMNPYELKDKFILPFVVRTEHANEKDITFAWSIICKYAEEVLSEGEEVANRIS